MSAETATEPTTSITTCPLVSVVMPARNEEAAIESAIESVLQQTHQNIELLVVDGLSTDRTADLVREFSRRDPRVRLLENPAQRIPNALNVALRAARGEYVARVDAHAGVSVDYLERGLRELQDPQVASVGGRRIGVAESRTGRAVAAALSSKFGVGGSVNHYGTHVQDTDHSSFGIYRKSVLDEVDGWDEALAVNEDVDIDYRILQQGYRIRYDPDMEILWHVRESYGEFARQYRRYGRGKALMVRKNGPSAVKPRHLAAPGLIVWLGGAAGLALTGHPGKAAALLGTYGAVVAVGAHDASRKAGDVSAVRAAGALATMHASWGLGFWEGLLFKAEPAAGSRREVR